MKGGGRYETVMAQYLSKKKTDTWILEDGKCQ